MQITASKKIVRSYDYSDFNQEREHITKEIINGRTYFKHGRYCSTAFVGDVYKVESNGEPFKYIMLIGLSRQHPNERQASREKGIEVAAINAKMCPVAEIKLCAIPEFSHFKKIIDSYLDTLPYEYVRTKEESLAIAEKNLTDEIRNGRKDITCMNTKLNIKNKTY